MAVDRQKIVARNEYRIQEVCSILGIERHTLLRYTTQNRIKCCFRQVSEHKCIKFYRGADIIAFLDQSELKLHC